MMKTLVLLSFLILVAKCDETRDSRFLSLFSVVSFKNAICNGTSSSSFTNPNGFPQGVCFSKADCDDKGGSDIGQCASGFGVCCQVTSDAASGSTNAKIAVFQNPSYPATTKSSGSYHLEVLANSKDICQLRIDICVLTMEPPTVSEDIALNTKAGLCETESLTIVGSDTLFKDSTLGISSLCGATAANQNQHIYVGDFTANENDLVVTIKASIGSTGSSWYTKVTQIDCYDSSDFMKNLRAPSGCAQYYTENTGTINSFNFGTDTNGKYQHYGYPQNYKICIKRDVASDCQVNIKRDTSVAAFTMSIGIGSRQEGLKDTTCMSATNDWSEAKPICSPYGGAGGTCTYDTDTNYCIPLFGCGSLGLARKTDTPASGIKSSGADQVRLATDNGCGSGTPAQGGCLDPANNLGDYLLIPQGYFERGCQEGKKDESQCLATNGNTITIGGTMFMHVDSGGFYTQENVYCGSGLGGDAPVCYPVDKCASGIHTNAVDNGNDGTNWDGISGSESTTSGTKYVPTTFGVLQQYQKNEPYFEMTFVVKDGVVEQNALSLLPQVDPTLNSDDVLRYSYGNYGTFDRLGFGITYEKATKCTTIDKTNSKAINERSHGLHNIIQNINLGNPSAVIVQNPDFQNNQGQNNAEVASHESENGRVDEIISMLKLLLTGNNDARKKQPESATMDREPTRNQAYVRRNRFQNPPSYDYYG